MTSPTTRTSSPARWGALAILLAALFAAPPALAQRIRPQVGKALGGKARPGYRPAKRATLSRPMRRASGQPPGRGALLTLPVAGMNAAFMDAAHYQDVRDVTLDLMRAHPPDKSFYVAVGRSPVAIASFLAELDPAMVMTFPASDMRLQINPAWKAAYFEHFRELIPDEVITGKRRIVLFDRSRAGSGTSLSVLKAYLDEYIATVPGGRARVRAVGLSTSGPMAPGVDFVDTSARPKVFLYSQGYYDHDEAVAPFVAKHRIGVNRMEDIVENPNHAPFRAALRSRMAHDAKLDAVLQTEFGDLLGDDR